MRQALRPTETGNQAEVDLRLTEARLLAGDDKVARHSELDAAAECEAIDGSDDGNRQILDGLHNAMAEARELQPLDGAHLRHLRDIGARDEGAISRPGDNQHAHRAIVANLAQPRCAICSRTDLLSALSAAGRLTVSVAIGAYVENYVGQFHRMNLTSKMAASTFQLRLFPMKLLR